MLDGHKVCLALRSTYLSMHRKADSVLLPQGITANQFVVLAALAEEDGISQKTLVERISSDPNTIRPILNALEDKGLVIREASHNDGRVWEVKLTRKGRTSFAKTSAKTEKFHKAIVSTLSRGEAEILIDLLGKVSEAVNCVNTKEVVRKSRPKKRAAIAAGK